MSTVASQSADDPEVSHDLAQVSAHWVGPPTAMGMLRASIKLALRNPLPFTALFAASVAAHLLQELLTTNFPLFPEGSTLFPIASLIEPAIWLGTVLHCAIAILVVRAMLPVYFAAAPNGTFNASALRPQYFRGFIAMLAVYMLQAYHEVLYLLPEMTAIRFLAVLLPIELFILIKLTFIAYIATFEQTTYLEAARLSWRRTTGYSWAIIRFICLLLLPFLLYLPITLMAASASLEDPNQIDFTSYTFAIPLGVLEIFGTLGPLWLYFEQRFGRIPDRSAPPHAAEIPA